jgi:hypothetical protein
MKQRRQQVGLGAIVVAVWMMVSGVTTPASAVNLGFETGDFSGWNVTIPTGIDSVGGFVHPAGQAAVYDTKSVYTYVPPGPGVFVNVSPVEGRFFGMVGTAPGWDFIPIPEGYKTMVEQSIALQAGQTLSGWARFWTSDYAPEDVAKVRVLDGGGSEVAMLWSETSGVTVPGDSISPWTEWAWAAPITGDFKLELSIIAQGDNLLPSYAFFDGIHITGGTQVPDGGATVFLMSIGMSCLLYLRRLSS